MIRLRAGKVQRQGVAPGGSSEITRPGLADPPPERAVGGRVGDVGAAAEDGDRAAAASRAPRWAQASIPKARPLTTTMPGRRQLAAEVAGDLAAVGGGPAGADDRHRRRTARGRRAAAGRRGRSAPRARRRRRAARRVEVAVAAAGPAAGRLAARPASCRSAQRRDPRQELPGHLRRHRRDQVLVARAAAVPASASRPRPVADLLDVGTEQRQQPGAAQAVGAGAVGSATVPPPQLQRLRHLLGADRSLLRRGRRSSAPAAAPGRGRGR